MLLRSTLTGLFFKGSPDEEWTADPLQAHRFVTEERAIAGALAWLDAHGEHLELCRNLTQPF